MKNKKTIQIIGQTIKLIFYAGIFAVFVLVFTSYLNLPGSLKLYWVQSGSMEPAIKTGSLIMLERNVPYAVGDIITFKSESERLEQNPKNTTTHRVVSEVIREDGKYFQTKGDANDVADINQTKADLVIGKVIFHIPYLGNIPAFARTRDGLIFMVIVPSTIIVYNELLNIKKEITNFVTAKRHAKSDS